MVEQSATLADRLELHREKMRNKAARRVKWNKERNPVKRGFFDSSAVPGKSRNTKKPHEHKREIARRARQGAN